MAYATLVAAPILSVAAPQPALAADCERGLLGLPHWFRGLTDGDCNIVGPGNTLPGGSAPLELSDFIWRIALNVVEIGLFIAGYVALFFILYGGFMFMTGGSNPGQIEKARLTIIQAAVGIAIAAGSIGAVNLIFRLING